MKSLSLRMKTFQHQLHLQQGGEASWQGLQQQSHLQHPYQYQWLAGACSAVQIIMKFAGNLMETLR
jgi:hypothetical protein